MPMPHVKAHTHRPIFRGFLAESVVELADSTAELADSSTDSVIVGRLSLSNMFDILRPLELADGPMVNLSSGYGPLIVRNPDVARHCNLYLPAMS